ncbi:nicotinate phosphoribosyltransferase [Raineyella antarctica]|uniref:Nicotinate phosphoribosyltransferase n=1 Tax=Raineyella antarctica TaxID=1577474 RepID=A0A1G6H473_9ACTN|nr:nicotinate phosphoribosyltransferase [Raineyella antarctica]SDB88953.1 nicotinate phosphoribosyltransferase [Raineyella antarctica]
MTSSALYTDHYELTMVEAAMQAGTASRRSIFELFPRRLPTGRRYGVVAGVGRAMEALEHFRFRDEELAFLREEQIVSAEVLDWLADYRFTGSIWGYPEGELYFPGSPLMVVEGGFAEACVLETVMLSIYNYDSAVASAGSRMTLMAGDRPCIEMGARRMHEEAAVAAARAAYIAGFASTSNLEAGRRHGIPTAGTAAHSFTLLHETEREAFEAQLRTQGKGTTLLVDTYSISDAVRTAVELAGPELGAVRIDSGDLAITAREVREQLDALGATKTRILVTSDLDEWQIGALAAAPVDGYGVGTNLVIGSGHPTCGFVYKLVARALTDGPDAELLPVAKTSANKSTRGGRKYAVRRLDERGIAEAEVVGVGSRPESDHNDRPLLVELVTDGKVLAGEDLEAARRRHWDSLAELPRAARKMSQGDPVIPTLYESDYE